jgi:tryptophan synthase alpha chain
MADLLARVRGATDVPVALGFGIATPADAAAAAAAGADGVIVGSRLVRAAAEAPEDPAGAVGAVVAELSAGLAR